jgi:hypothetical protein
MIQALGARYSPHDNPVERVWGSLKAWLANTPTLTIQGRVRQVHAFFRQRSPAQLLATAPPDSSPWLPRPIQTLPSGGRLAVAWTAVRRRPVEPVARRHHGTGRG